MTDEPKFTPSLLSEKDADRLYAMLSVFGQCLYKVVTFIERDLKIKYNQDKQYKELVKRYGKPQADRIVADYCQKIFRRDERLQIGKILKQIDDLKKSLDEMGNTCAFSHGDNTTDGEMLDLLIHDANFLCYLYLLCSDAMTEDSSELKIISTIKSFKKKHAISDALYYLFEYEIPN